MLLVVGLGWGGYVGYRQLAPYYGLGYATGRDGTVAGVTFTVTDARCGLTEPPGKQLTSVKGQFCTVEISARNSGSKPRFVSLTLFSVQLDTGYSVRPATSAMTALSLKIEPGQTQKIHLVYDVWEGIRMDSLKVQIGYETANIPLV
ncbi:MAG: DUF4352 domain-containing protein [Micromonosporaceae bacterium]